jgi:hypothetical protein
MTQQTINIGSAPNDGTGDPARTAFGKVNSNFSEVYSYQSSWNQIPTLVSNGLLNTPYTGFVATRCDVNNSNNTGNKQTFSRVRHIAMENLTTVQFIYTTMGKQGVAVETYAGAAASVRASFEYNGVVTQITFGGSTTGTIPVFGILVSDVITIPTPITRGTVFYSRTWQSSTWGIVWNGELLANNNLSGVNSGGDTFTYGVTTTDYTNSLTVPANAALGVFGPAAIVAPTTRPSFLLVGDSRVYAQGGESSYGAQSQYGGYGNIARWMVKRFACLNLGISSDQIKYVAYSGSSLSNVQTTGTAGQFSCSTSSSPLLVGMTVTVSGTNTGTGSITGYSNPTTYKISATNGSTTFTLIDSANSALVTTAGTLTGLTITYANWNVRGLFVPYVSHVINEMGINDCAAATAYTTTIANLYTFTRNKLAGKPVFQCTLEPETTSTDFWVTTTNQTIDATTNTQRVPFNDAVRQGLEYPIAGCIELANQVETSVNSGIIKMVTPSRVVTDGAMTAGQYTLTSATAKFSWDDLGKSVVVSGSGTAGAAVSYWITTYNSTTSVSLNSAAVTTVTGATVTWVITNDGIHLSKDANQMIEFSSAFDAVSFLIP